MFLFLLWLMKGSLTFQKLLCYPLIMNTMVCIWMVEGFLVNYFLMAVTIVLVTPIQICGHNAVYYFTREVHVLVKRCWCTNTAPTFWVHCALLFTYCCGSPPDPLCKAWMQVFFFLWLTLDCGHQLLWNSNLYVLVPTVSIIPGLGYDYSSVVCGNNTYAELTHLHSQE